MNHDFRRNIEKSLTKSIPGKALEIVLKEHFATSLNVINSEYDCVIFDCPASANDYASAAIMLSHCMIAPTKLDSNSLADLTRLLTNVDIKWNKNLDEFVRVLICSYDSTSETQNINLQRIKGHNFGYRTFEEPISQSDEILKAMEYPKLGRRRWNQKYDNGSDLVVRSLAKAVIGEFGQSMKKSPPQKK